LYVRILHAYVQEPNLERSKVPKTFRLDPRKISAAQRILRSKTQTEAIEVALDMVVFRERLVEGTKRMFGRRFAYPDAGEPE
jgi:hypothetical protein